VLVSNDNIEFEMSRKNFNSHSDYKRKRNKSIHYVIDGSQRLRVLYNVLSYGDNENLLNVGFDLNKEKFVFLKASNENRSSVIDLKNLFYSNKYIEHQLKINSSPRNRHYLSDINKLVSIFNNYEIPIIMLDDVTYNEVIEIYTRLNRNGSKLSNEELHRLRNTFIR
jgi:hypothetical protein